MWVCEGVLCVVRAGDPGVSGDFWGSQEGCQGPSRLCDPMDCSPPGSSVHGIFQAKVLEWGAIAFSAPQARHLAFSPGKEQAAGVWET